MEEHQDGLLLITGGLGIVGRELVARLLGAGAAVRLLLRPRQGLGAGGRLAQFLAAEGLAGAAAEAIEGDLTLPGLGLGSGQAERAAHGVSAVVHVAGSTQFDATRDGEPFASNVQGTARVLEFAERFGIGRFHHVSTAYVAGRVSGTINPDDARRPPLFTNAYEKSKWQGEQLARRFAARTGATLTIHRPGIVVGRWADGSIHRFNGLYRVLRTLDTMRQRWRGGREGDGGVVLPLVLPGRSAAGRRAAGLGRGADGRDCSGPAMRRRGLADRPPPPAYRAPASRLDQRGASDAGRVDL
jgi:nucleoside-diphosphate-sugar epimerase